MFLQDLIDQLEKYDPSTPVPLGFGRPHSWRGHYYELAFEPVRDTTIGAMLEAARSALGATYEGWKGGEYTMSGYSYVHISNEGESYDHMLGMLLRYMVGATHDDLSTNA